MPKTMPSMWEEVTVADVVSNVFVETATLAWVFFLGAAVGSFVNVILYRMPRRINLLWPPSRCPACLHRLKLVDNLPVVGWVRLRGKCRHCGAAIPRSYLRVEVGFGLLFLALTYLEIHTGGWNLPLRAPNQHPGALWNLWYPRPDLVRIWVYHLALVGVMGTLFLFARRGERFPGLFVVASLAAGVLPTASLAGLHQVPWANLGARGAADWQFTGATEAALGLAGGTVLGAVLALLLPTRIGLVSAERPRFAIPPRWNVAIVLAVAGAWLGWQAALSIAVLTAAFGVARLRASATALAVGATAVHLVVWRPLTKFALWWPGPHTSFALAAVWAVVAAVLALAARHRPAPVTAEGSIAGPSAPAETRRTAPEVPGADSGAGSESRS